MKNGVPVVVEPRCKVCMSPHRNAIDALLAGGYSYSEIARHFDGIERRSISNHYKEHLDYENAAIRTIIEREAAAAQKNHEEGVDRLITKQTYLEVALQKAYDQVLSGDTEITAGEAVKLIEMAQRLEERTHDVAVDEMRSQFNAFMQAVKSTVPPDMWEEIRDLTHTNLAQAGRGQFIGEEVIQDAEVVETKELPQ